MKTDTAPAMRGCLHLTWKDIVSERRHVLLERNRLLARIEAALARMEEGRFGYCTQCSGKIPMDCLETDPAMARCLECRETG
jgi:DnaK suppressor protein